jgi:hypothetical protein
VLMATRYHDSVVPKRGAGDHAPHTDTTVFHVMAALLRTPRSQCASRAPKLVKTGRKRKSKR